MTRCLIETDVYFAMCDHPATLGHIERVLTDPEWQRCLAGPRPITTTPEHVFEALIDMLTFADHPTDADTSLVETRDRARAVVKEWFNDAAAGQAHAELSAYSCWALFRLIRQIERTATALVEARCKAALNAAWTDYDLAAIEPAPLRVEV